LILNYHVVKDATKVRLLTRAGLIDAKVVQVDAANDLAFVEGGRTVCTAAIAASVLRNLNFSRCRFMRRLLNSTRQPMHA
jgi:hypothetical protein